jgi:hypothetical protein
MTWEASHAESTLATTGRRSHAASAYDAPHESHRARHSPAVSAAFSRAAAREAELVPPRATRTT